MSCKIGFIKDKSDLVINITNDNIINITGMMGSGKTTLGKNMHQEKNIELISLDWLFGYSIGNRPDKINKVIKEIEKKYKETKDQIIFQYSNNRKENRKVKQNYEKYAGKIYEYLIENYVTEPVIIEGIQISKYVKTTDIKGTIIIKRTSLLHSYKRAFNRDVLRRWMMYKNKEITIKGVRDKFFKRIKIPFEDYIKINRFIREVVSMNKNCEKIDKNI